MYTLVEKKINSRFCERTADNYENPAPGTVVDSGLIEYVPSTSQFDFYMIAHKATIATALPVHYFVAENSTQMGKDEIQTFTYHLCHNFFNFMGTTKVPAAVMYAEKIARYTHEYLYSKKIEAVQVPPNERLSLNLHYI